jgi:hypothetical protein
LIKLHVNGLVWSTNIIKLLLVHLSYLLQAKFVLVTFVASRT